MVDRRLNGLPTFENPFERKADRFSVWGFRKMALGVLIVSLEELTWDPSTGRSQAERREMARAKEEAVPWFRSDAFEAFASMAQLPVSNEALRARCLAEPLIVLEELRAVRASMDDKRVTEHQRQAVAAMSPRNLPANNWLFGDVIESLSETVRGALNRARGVPSATPEKRQGFLFDEVATAKERVKWSSVAREPLRHRVTP